MCEAYSVMKFNHNNNKTLRTVVGLTHQEIKLRIVGNVLYYVAECYVKFLWFMKKIL